MQTEDVTRMTQSELKKKKTEENKKLYYNNEPISLTPSNATKDQISLYVPWAYSKHI